jgi:hypothetical protein
MRTTPPGPLGPVGRLPALGRPYSTNHGLSRAKLGKGAWDATDLKPIVDRALGVRVMAHLGWDAAKAPEGAPTRREGISDLSVLWPKPPEGF